MLCHRKMTFVVDSFQTSLSLKGSRIEAAYELSKLVLQVETAEELSHH